MPTHCGPDASHPRRLPGNARRIPHRPNAPRSQETHLRARPCGLVLGPRGPQAPPPPPPGSSLSAPERREILSGAAASPSRSDPPPSGRPACAGDRSARLGRARLADGNAPGTAPRGSEERAWLKLERAWGGLSCSGFSPAAARHAVMAATFFLRRAPLLVASLGGAENARS